MTKRNRKSSGPVFLRGLPFLLTLMLFLSLMLTMTGPEAQAESSGAGAEDEDLPEYSILLSDAQSTSDSGRCQHHEFRFRRHLCPFRGQSRDQPEGQHGQHARQRRKLCADR